MHWEISWEPVGVAAGIFPASKGRTIKDAELVPGVTRRVVSAGVLPPHREVQPSWRPSVFPKIRCWPARSHVALYRDERCGYR